MRQWCDDRYSNDDKFRTDGRKKSIKFVGMRNKNRRKICLDDERTDESG